MTQKISDNLFFAILAMDAYNRGYDAKLSGLSDAIGTKIGNATVIGSAGDAAAKADGFYAIAYELNGQKIISYRGTDDPSLFSQSSDLWNGWVQGAGILSSQSEDAIRFYERIAGQSVFKPNAGVVTTGHSLGGGLAGYVAALSNGTAFIYDAMPFGAASITRVIKEQMNQANVLTGPVELTAFLTTGLSRFVMMPDADHVNYISVNGEVLEPVRALATTAGSALEVGVATALISSKPAYLPIAVTTGVLAGPWSLAVSLEGSKTKLDAVAKKLGAVDLHSQSLLAILQYAKDHQYTEWHQIADSLFSGWFAKDDAIAKPLGLTNDQMLRQIVYSALDGGETPYGTAAIKALFDDANELGRFYSLPKLFGNWSQTSVKNDLSSIVSQYSGNLALNKITDTSLAEGVFDYHMDGNIISLDLRKSSWDLGASTSEAVAQFSAQKKSLIEKLTAGFLNINEITTVDVIISAAQHSDAIVGPLFDIAKTDSALILSDGLNDKITGTAGHDYIYAYDTGNDTVDGGGGINTSVYKGRVSDYKVVKTDSGLILTELISGTEQTDILQNIQQIKFADQEVRSDLAQTFSTFSVNRVTPLENQTLPTDGYRNLVEKGVTVAYDLTSHLTDEIVGLYEFYFDRLPDVDGLRFWVDTALSWGNDLHALDKVSESFLASDEFLSINQNLSAEAFIDYLYRTGLNRAPDSEGKAYWLNALAEGMSRDDLAMSFTLSPEIDLIVGHRASTASGVWMDS